MSRIRHPSLANGGVSPQLGRALKRPPYGYSPSIQPGHAPLPVSGNDRDARHPFFIPDHLDLRNPEHLALLTAVGIERALQSDHVRYLIQSMLDNVARATWKPTTAPPWIEKPYRAVDFGGEVTQTVASGGSYADMTDGTTTLSFTMPNGMMGVLREFAQGATSPTDYDSLCWRLVRNDVPLFPWNDICCQMGSLDRPRPVQIIIQPGETISLQAKNTSGAGIDNVLGWLYGWMWPTPQAGGGGNAHSQASVA